MKANKLISIIDRFRKKRIAVIGDLMLDVYLWGRATRISPEAPVPVVSIDRTSSCLGGAANVMRNLVTLGGSALAFGMIGDDADGRELCRQLAEYGINPESVCVDEKLTRSFLRTTPKACCPTKCWPPSCPPPPGAASSPRWIRNPVISPRSVA